MVEIVCSSSFRDSLPIIPGELSFSMVYKIFAILTGTEVVNQGKHMGMDGLCNPLTEHAHSVVY